MIVLYKGRRGCGKTVTLVKDGYLNKLRGFKILRNFSLSFGKYISNEEILNLNKDSLLFDCVLMIDEIQIFFDSRRSMRKQNLTFSNFIQQIRKRNIILLCTAQYSNTIDLRLRQHLDIIAYPKFYKDLNVCEVIYEDLTALEENFFMGREPNRVKLVFDAVPFFKLYKTDEMII